MCNRGHPQWHDLPVEVNKNLTIISSVLRGETQTDRQNVNLISLTFPFKESKLTVVCGLFKNTNRAFIWKDLEKSTKNVTVACRWPEFEPSTH